MNRARQTRADPNEWIQTEVYERTRKLSQSWGRRRGLKKGTLEDLAQESIVVLLTMAQGGRFPPPDDRDWGSPVNTVVKLRALANQRIEFLARTRTVSIDNLGDRPAQTNRRPETSSRPLSGR